MQSGGGRAMSGLLALVLLFGAPPVGEGAGPAADVADAAADAAAGEGGAPDPAAVERARELYQAGSAAYEATRYAVAVEAFEEAYRLAPRPTVMFSLAQAQRLQYFLDGDAARLRRAVELYRRYADGVGDGGRRDDAIQHLRDLVPLMQRDGGGADAPARLIVSTDAPGATARVDEGEARAIPATFQVSPGARRLTVAAPEFVSRVIETTAVGGSTVALNVTLTPEPGALTVDAPAGARVEIDGRSLGSAPVAPVLLAPGRHRVVVVDAGRVPFVQSVVLGRAEAVTIVAPLEVTGQRVAAGSLFGVAGALVVGAGVAAGFALDAEAEAQVIEGRWRSRGLSGAEVAAFEARVGERDERARWAVGLGSGAVALVGLATVLWVFDRAEAPAEPMVTPTVGGGSGGIRGGWRF